MDDIILQDAPYISKRSDGEYIGFIPDIFEKLGYNLTIVEDTKYGMKDDSNNWTGLMKTVVDKVGCLVTRHTLTSLAAF